MISTIFGRDKTLAGTVTLDGRDITGLSTRKILQEGINFVPEDRHYHGLFKIRSISSNTTSALLGSREMGKVDMNRRHQREISQQYADQVPHQDRLSGRPHRQPVGRQPAKGGHLPRPVHPPQGRHPRRTHPRHRRRRPQRRVRIIRQLKEEGVAVLMVSSDIEEVVELADRAITIFQGRINGEFSHDEISQDALTSASFGIGHERVVAK